MNVQRILLGDSTKDLAKLLHGKAPETCVTYPPFYIGPNTDPRIPAGNLGTEETHEKYIERLCAVFEELHALGTKRFVILTGDSPHAHTQKQSTAMLLMQHFSLDGLSVIADSQKRNDLLLVGELANHETVQRMTNFGIGDTQRSNDDILRSRCSLTLVRTMVSFASGDIVDPFGGEGTTNIGAMHQHRNATSIDIFPRRVKEALLRLSLTKQMEHRDDVQIETNIEWDFLTYATT